MTAVTFLTAHCPACHDGLGFDCDHEQCPRCASHGSGRVSVDSIDVELADAVAMPGRLDELSRQVHNLTVDLEDAMTDEARARALRLIDAEATVVAQAAEIEYLKTRCVEIQTQADVAEQVATRLRTEYERSSWVPGDAEPPADNVVRVVVALQTGAIYRRQMLGGEQRWALFESHRTGYTWAEVLEGAPVVDITGWHSERLAKVIDDDRQAADDIRAALWDFEWAVLTSHRMTTYGLERDRHHTGSVEEARAILSNATMLVSRLEAALR